MEGMHDTFNLTSLISYASGYAKMLHGNVHCSILQNIIHAEHSGRAIIDYAKTE